jgi:Mrp family chromosome partitioning ATPase
MTQAAIDLIDRAFIGRFQGQAVDLPESPARSAERAAPVTSRESAPAAFSTCQAGGITEGFSDRQPPHPAADQWALIADEVERAAAEGCRVIAVVAVRRGEGCSTVAHGAVRALLARGRRAACVTKPPLQTAAADADANAADIVIVDAGNWFPPGPIRRHQVSRHAFGCDAVILVRRADFPPCVAHAESLAAIGLRVLGEVETFADDAAHPARESPDA